MPIYDYKCQKCGESFSMVMGIKEKETKKVRCAKCKSLRVSPVYSGFFAMTSKKS